MRKRSIKNTRVNVEVQRELSSIIRGGIKDPRVAPWTSVVAAEVAPDLKTCKAYISVLGDEKAQQETIKGLTSAEGYIRRELARTLNLRNTPEIRFILDQSIEYGVNMSKKIEEVTGGMEAEEDVRQTDRSCLRTGTMTCSAVWIAETKSGWAFPGSFSTGRLIRSVWIIISVIQISEKKIMWSRMPVPPQN